MKTKQLQKFTSKRARKAGLKVILTNALQSGLGLLRFWAGLMVMIFLALSPIVLAVDGQKGKGEDVVVRTTLDNGLKVVIVRIPLAPVVSTVVNYLVGSNEAPEGFPGTAHAQEHMMFRGSSELSADQLADIAAFMGGMFDADTQQTVTQYFFTVPAEDLDVALHIEAIRMAGVSDSEKLWQQERGAIEQEVAQDLSNPEYVFYTKLLSAMFRGTPYANTPLGTRPSFNKTTGAMLKNFHDTWYVPKNAILVIVGNVKPEIVLSQVKKYFDYIPAKKLPERPALQLKPVTPDTLQLKTDLPVGLAIISFRMPGYDSPDYAASQVLADILSSQRSNLYALVPQGKALSTSFDLNTLPKAGLGYAIAAFPKGSDAKTLMQKVKQILSDDIKKGFSADLVEAAKRHEVADAEFQKNSIFGFATTWSQALAVEGRQSPEEEVEAIQHVTVADVNRVARKYLDFGHAIEAILTPEVSGKPISSKGFGGVESFAPQQTRTVKLPDWAENALKRLSIPASTLSPQESTLPNGIRLIVQPVSVSNTISIYGHVKTQPDLEAPKGQEGVQLVLDQLFSYGTTSLDRLAFQKALDDIGANESSSTDFSLQVLTDHFNRGVQLLADNVLHPALPEPAFKTVQKQVAGSVAGQIQSPDYLAGRALKAALFPKQDPTLRQATPDTIGALTLKDVKNYYEKAFRPDLTTIVVIGKVTPEKAKEIIEQYFGEWKSTGSKPNTLLPSVPLNKPSTIRVPDESRVQNEVLLAETIDLTRSNPDYYALELGNGILGGGFYATRLYQDLREKTGLVYYVSSNFDISRTRGLYIVKYGCDPQNVYKACGIVKQNLQKMQNSLVGRDQLEQAKAMLLRKIPLSESSVSSIAEGFISRINLDLHLDEPTLAAHRYVKLNSEQVQSAFAKYVRPDALVQVTQGPNPK